MVPILLHSSENTPEFIEGEDCVLVRAVNNERDTIAYIPNNVMRTAESQIKIAYDAQDYEEVYRIFNEAFTFLAGNRAGMAGHQGGRAGLILLLSCSRS